MSFSFVRILVAVVSVSFFSQVEAGVSPSSKVSISSTYSKVGIKKSKTILVTLSGKAALEVGSLLTSVAGKGSQIFCTIVTEATARCGFFLDSHGGIRNTYSYVEGDQVMRASVQEAFDSDFRSTWIHRTNYKTSAVGIRSLASTSRGVDLKGSVAMLIAKLMKHQSLNSNLPSLLANENTSSPQIRCKLTADLVSSCQFRVSPSGRVFAK